MVKPIYPIYELKAGYVNVYLNKKETEIEGGLVFSSPLEKLERITYNTFLEILKNLYDLSQKQTTVYVQKKDIFQHLKTIYKIQDQNKLVTPAHLQQVTYKQCHRNSTIVEDMGRIETYIMQGSSVFGNFRTETGQYVDTGKYEILLHYGKQAEGGMLERIDVYQNKQEVPYLSNYLQKHYSSHMGNVVEFLEERLLCNAPAPMQEQVNNILAGNQNKIHWEQM